MSWCDKCDSGNPESSSSKEETFSFPGLSSLPGSGSSSLPSFSSFLGSYKLTKSENFDEYMQALGVSYLLRKMSATATPITDIKKEGDTWTIKTTTTFKTTEIKFKLGQEFDEVTADGRKCKSTITLNGDNLLVHMQKCGGPPLRITRQFDKDQMTMKLEAPGGIVSTRIYKKQ